jgi:hypothetical protein
MGGASSMHRRDENAYIALLEKLNGRDQSEGLVVNGKKILE